MRFSDKAKDWYIQGFQLNKVYIEDWEEIKSIFSAYKANLNTYGPIITMNELSNTREAATLTELLFKNSHYHEIIDCDYAHEMKLLLFLTNLSLLPLFSKEISLPLYKQWIEEPDDFMKQILKQKGTVKEKYKNTEELIKKAIVLFRKKEDLKV